MKPVMQTKRGGPDVPPEERGDCWSACLASLLEVGIEDVPVPHSDDPAWHWWDATRDALHSHGHECIVASAAIWPYGYWLASVPSKNLGAKVNHVIVMHNGEVAHDPSLGERYAAGTSIEDLEVREAYALVPLEVRSILADREKVAV